ncbi:hypothetical protein H4R18_005375 [Coemansia javaensis]|uniref:Uncharacterized protein n=1 Tax=Coemansia javaensis TaxID=2761396 RepID=A0A9W8LFG7_9FUNG|nr:hypothetical protein H4R18_005375 [Coemansia javaensis]
MAAQVSSAPWLRSSSSSGGGGSKAAGSEAAAAADASRQTLALRLAGLAAAVYLARFMLGLLKYVVDAALLLLVACCVAAAAGPGLKNDTVSQLLARLEAAVDPLFAALADRGAGAVSGPARSIATYLGLGSARADAGSSPSSSSSS